MKKTIFLTGLFLMIIGVANIDAQVRIGSEEAPDVSAVLDLNPNNTDNAQGGLLLPRVRLHNLTHKVFGIDVPIARGLMVYHMDSSTGLKEGVYVYTGTEWRLISEDISAPDDATR
jgi:hypothetical protein